MGEITIIANPRDSLVPRIFCAYVPAKKKNVMDHLRNSIKSQKNQTSCTDILSKKREKRYDLCIEIQNEYIVYYC